MASHASTSTRRKGDRGNQNYFRRDQPWGSPRSGLPGSHAMNGSPYSARRRDPQHQQQQQHQRQQQQQPQYRQQHYQPQQTGLSDHEQYREYLQSTWDKICKQVVSGQSTYYIVRAHSPTNELRDFVPVNLDECIAQAHQQDKPGQ